MHLSEAQIAAETKEIEKFLDYRPSHFRRICEGWDMRRILVVDFAGDDGNGAGEGIFTMKRGIEEGEHPEIKRLARWKSEQAPREEYPLPQTPSSPLIPRTAPSMASLFGGGRATSPIRNLSSERSPTSSILSEAPATDPGRTSSPEQSPSMSGTLIVREPSTFLVEEWRSSILALKADVEITTSTIDSSTFALLTVDEDPLRIMKGEPASSTSSNAGDSTPVPGSRARFLAVGTNTGEIVVWNARGPQSTNGTLVNELRPLRTIQTDSPQISCLAMSALYVVHGGSDGLVQSWDPLRSTLLPVRTLNSRFSSRARRRLVHAEASITGVGINMFAASAICIDPDPTVLRGMVSLGTHLRYWSYSSSAADLYQKKKRRLRRSNERGSNGGLDRSTNTGRGALMDYIATEQEELKKEKIRQMSQNARLQERYGVGLGGLTDEEALQYTKLISAETHQKDQESRTSDTGYIADAGEASSMAVTPDGSVVSRAISPYDHDLEEAIRLSLLEGVDSEGRSPQSSGQYDIPIRYKQKKSRRSASSSPSTSQASKNRSKALVAESRSAAVAADDLDYALQLSMAEERSLMESATVSDSEAEEFPSLAGRTVGKGKGKAKQGH